MVSACAEPAHRTKQTMCTCFTRLLTRRFVSCRLACDTQSATQHDIWHAFLTWYMMWYMSFLNSSLQICGEPVTQLCAS